MVWGHCLLLFFYFALMKVKKIREKLGQYLFYNAYIRLIMESFQDFCLLASLNLKMADWDSPFAAVMYSNYLSACIMVLICTLPIIFFIVLMKNKSKWNDPAFQSQYGSILTGTKT